MSFCGHCRHADGGCGCADERRAGRDCGVGVDASDLLCRTVVEYGYRADKGCWQVDFTIPQRDMADDAYEVEVDDKDGKVTGLWGPQDGNG